MRPELLRILRCTACGGELAGDPTDTTGGEWLAGVLTCRGCSARYPIVNGVPRFVSPENYAGSFGFQWNRFRRTQLDSVTGTTISRDRFLRSAGLKAPDLAGKLVLDAGCGAGRFAEVALSLGATVVAVDYSAAVDACRANLGSQERGEVVQADIYRLPFAPASFDFVYCLGVLQHTPDVAGAFQALPSQLRPGGRLAVDLYPKLVWNLVWPKYWLRPLTKRLPQQALFRWVERLVPILLPISDLLRRVPRSRGRLRYLVPVANYRGVFPLTDEQLREWAVLDTFDMLAPAYDKPQTPATLRGWLERAGLHDVEVEHVGFIVGRGAIPLHRGA